MTYTTLIRGMINLSSAVQTYLLNYLEFHGDPKDLEEKGYRFFSARPERPKEVLTPFQKEDVVKPHYSVLLALAKEQGREVHPVLHRSFPLRSLEKTCRKCKAPKEYLKNHGYYLRKSTGEFFPKHTCKVCYAEYAPGAERKKPSHICPYCGYAMSVQKYRKDFDVYFCKEKECSHIALHPKGYRYHEKEWHFTYDQLSTHALYSKKSLEKIRVRKNFLNLEMSLFINSGMSLRETKTILQLLYGKGCLQAHQTILNHAEALAAFVKEQEEFLPLRFSTVVVEDETYLKYGGKWGYLFRAFDPISRTILAEYFSPHRDTKSCIILNKIVRETFLKQGRDPEYDLISDGAPLYPAMKGYFEEEGKAVMHHTAIIGVFPKDGEDVKKRAQKQMIERSFGTLKSATKRRRTFSSFRGAEIFCYLHKIFYNYLRPHSELNHLPPVPLYLKNGSRVTEWNELILYLSEKKR